MSAVKRPARQGARAAPKPSANGQTPAAPTVPLPPHTFGKLPLKKLKPAPYNPRVMTEAALQGLAASIQKFGLVEPLIWNKRTGYVVGGHQRVRALERLGETEAEVMIVDLSNAEEKELNVTLNKQTGDWDYAALKRLMAELNPDAELRALMGFDEKELKNLMKWGETITDGPPGKLGITPGDALKIYENAAIKQMVLYFETEQYVEVMEQMRAIAEAHDPPLESNSDVVTFLIGFYHGKVSSKPKAARP